MSLGNIWSKFHTTEVIVSLPVVIKACVTIYDVVHAWPCTVFKHVWVSPERGGNHVEHDVTMFEWWNKSNFEGFVADASVGQRVEKQLNYLHFIWLKADKHRDCWDHSSKEYTEELRELFTALSFSNSSHDAQAEMKQSCSYSEGDAEPWYVISHNCYYLWQFAKLESVEDNFDAACSYEVANEGTQTSW